MVMAALALVECDVNVDREVYPLTATCFLTRTRIGLPAATTLGQCAPRLARLGFRQSHLPLLIPERKGIVMIRTLGGRTAKPAQKMVLFAFWTSTGVPNYRRIWHSDRVDHEEITEVEDNADREVAHSKWRGDGHVYFRS